MLFQVIYMRKSCYLHLQGRCQASAKTQRSEGLKAEGAWICLLMMLTMTADQSQAKKATIIPRMLDQYLSDRKAEEEEEEEEAVMSNVAAWLVNDRYRAGSITVLATASVRGAAVECHRRSKQSE